MRTLLLQPHADDVIFCAYQVIAHRPDVIRVLDAADAKEAAIRANEDAAAMEVLGTWVLPFALGIEGKPDWPKMLGVLRDYAEVYEHCFAPAFEIGGHDEHNGVAAMAEEVFGGGRLTCYATYRRGHGRTRTGKEVIPEERWAARKFRAMACYESQIERENTRPWFAADDCLREWIA